MSKNICPICGEGVFQKEIKKDNKKLFVYSCGCKCRATRLVLYYSTKGIIPSPVPTLKEIIHKKEWFKGLILSVTYFEYYGKQVLKEYFDSNNLRISINNMSIDTLLDFLYACKIITHSIYCKMNEVRKKRNDIVHMGKEFKDIRLLNLKEEKEMENLLIKAIECIKFLLYC